MSNFDFVNYRGLSKRVAGHPRRIKPDYTPKEHLLIMHKVEYYLNKINQILINHERRNVPGSEE